MSANSIYKKFQFKFKPPAQPLKPNVIHLPKEEWRNNKKPMYQWAENEAAKKGYKPAILNTLKMLITYTDPKGKTHITLETIHNKLIAKYGKAAPSKRSLDNHIAALVAGKTIKRSAQQKYKSLITTRLLMGKLEDRSTQLLRTEYISHKDIYIGEEVIAQTSASPLDDSKILKQQVEASCPARLPDGCARADVPKPTKEQREKQLQMFLKMKLGDKFIIKLGFIKQNGEWIDGQTENEGIEN